MENFQQCSKPKNKTFISNIIIIFGLSCLSFVYECAQQNTRCLFWEQEAAGSNPVTPTYSYSPSVEGLYLYWEVARSRLS